MDLKAFERHPMSSDQQQVFGKLDHRLASVPSVQVLHEVMASDCEKSDALGLRFNDRFLGISGDC